MYTQEDTWNPWLNSTDCLEELSWCKTTGYMADLMGYLQVMYNFTWKSTKDPNGDWGVVPISGPSNSSGTWGGIVGSLVDQTVQMSVSAWITGSDRLSIFDFAQIYPSGILHTYLSVLESCYLF